MDLRQKFVHAAIEYDKQEERKAIRRKYPHSIYLLAHCLKAVDEIMLDIEAGIEPETAICNRTLDRLRAKLLRVIKK